MDYRFCSYVSFKTGYITKFRRGKSHPSWEKALCYLSEPKPYKNTFWYYDNAIIIPEYLIGNFISCFDKNVEILPIDVEGKGNAYIINVVNLDSTSLIYDECIFLNNGTEVLGRDMDNLSRRNKPQILKFAFENLKLNSSFFNTQINSNVISPTTGQNFFPTIYGPFYLQNESNPYDFVNTILKLDIKGLFIEECKIV